MQFIRRLAASPFPAQSLLRSDTETPTPFFSFHLFVAHDRAIPIRPFQIVYCRTLHRTFRSIWIRKTECKNIVHESTRFSTGAHCYFDLLGVNVVQYEKGVHIRNFKLLVIADFSGDAVNGPTSTE